MIPRETRSMSVTDLEIDTFVPLVCSCSSIGILSDRHLPSRNSWRKLL